MVRRQSLLVQALPHSTPRKGKGGLLLSQGPVPGLEGTNCYFRQCFQMEGPGRGGGERMWDTRELAAHSLLFLMENACWWEGVGRSWAALGTEI